MNMHVIKSNIVHFINDVSHLLQNLFNHIYLQCVDIYWWHIMPNTWCYLYTCMWTTQYNSQLQYLHEKTGGGFVGIWAYEFQSINFFKQSPSPGLTPCSTPIIQ